MSKRLDYLQGWFHDAAIQARTSEKCGKMFPSIRCIAELCEGIEEVIKEVKKIDDVR